MRKNQPFRPAAEAKCVADVRLPVHAAAAKEDTNAIGALPGIRVTVMPVLNRPRTEQDLQDGSKPETPQKQKNKGFRECRTPVRRGSMTSRKQPSYPEKKNPKSAENH